MYKFLHRLKVSHYISKHFLSVNFLPFKFIYWLLSKVSFTRTIQNKKSNYKVFVSGGIGWMNLISNYEPWFEKILDSIVLNEETVFVDIGANIGQTMLKVLSRNSSVRYIGFEPNKKCMVYLEKLAGLNSYQNISLYNFALSDRKGETSLHLRFDDDLLATTTPSFRKYTNYAKKQTVLEITGDELLEKEAIDTVSVIKIDVEGGETKVLLGLKRTITEYHPIIICEVLPLYSKSEEVSTFRKSSAIKILEIVCDLDYQIYNIKNKTEITSVNDFSSSLESANYILLPAGELNDFRLQLGLE